MHLPRAAVASVHRAVYPYMFDKKGQIIIDKEECEMDPDELMMLALDAGAEDFSEEEDSFEILTAPDDFSDVRQKHWRRRAFRWLPQR